MAYRYTNANKTTGSSRERRIRQIMAYFTYYWGGVIDIATACELFVAYSRFRTSSLSGAVPPVRLITTPKDVGEAMLVHKTLLTLGTKGDSGKSPRFVNLGNDKLACRELPADFYESFFTPEEKDRLNWAMAFHIYTKGEDEQLNFISSVEQLKERIKPKPPAEPWEGFDVNTALEQAEKLKEERLGKLLEKYPKPDPEPEDE